MADYYCENCEFFEDRSTDKLIDGYCKKYNQSLEFYDWFEKCDKCMIETLKAENDSLKKRLENATDLPCKVGDRFYIVEYYPPEIIEEECCDFSFREFPKILLENGCDCTYELGDNGSYFVTFDKNEAKKIFEKLKKEQRND